MGHFEASGSSSHLCGSSAARDRATTWQLPQGLRRKPGGLWLHPDSLSPRERHPGGGHRQRQPALRGRGRTYAMRADLLEDPYRPTWPRAQALPGGATIAPPRPTLSIRPAHRRDLPEERALDARRRRHVRTPRWFRNTVGQQGLESPTACLQPSQVDVHGLRRQRSS